MLVRFQPSVLAWGGEHVNNLTGWLETVYGCHAYPKKTPNTRGGDYQMPQRESWKTDSESWSTTIWYGYFINRYNIPIKRWWHTLVRVYVPVAQLVEHMTCPNSSAEERKLRETEASSAWVQISLWAPLIMGSGVRASPGTPNFNTPLLACKRTKLKI